MSIKAHVVGLAALAFLGAGGIAPQLPAGGIWIDRAALAELPMAGDAWLRLVKAAREPCGAPSLSDQDDDTNTCVMAKALVAARTGDSLMRQHVIAALMQVAGGGPYRGRDLALGRELIAYVIAAGVIGLTDWTHAR